MSQIKFSKEICDLCGECLYACPQLNISKDKAKEEIRRLISGENSQVLNRCTSCFACNLYCEKDCKPYYLILKTWEKRYKRRGIPYFLKLGLPHSTINIWTRLHMKLPSDEKRLLKMGKTHNNKERVLFIGCNQQLNPYITFTKIFDNLPILANRDLCCGEPYYRMGFLEYVEKSTKRLQNRFQKLKIKEMIVFCPACYNMFTNILPHQFRAKFDFKTISLLEFLADKIKTGSIAPHQSFTCSLVTVQDSCHSKMIGKDYLNLSRKILSCLGIKIGEMEHNKENALCCGLGAAAARYSLIDIFRCYRRRIKEAQKTKAEAIVCYCNGCFLTFTLGSLFYPNSPPIFHLIEVIQEVIGEKPIARHKLRAKQMVKAGLMLALPAILKKKRVYLEE